MRYVIETFYDTLGALDTLVETKQPSNNFMLYVTKTNGMQLTTNMQFSVLGKYEPTLQPIQTGFSSNEVSTILDSVMSKYTDNQKEILKMCCNCNSNNQKVYFDKMYSGSTPELSPEFLSKKLDTLTHNEFKVVVDYYRIRRSDGMKNEDATIRVDGFFVNYPTYTVSQAIDYWF